MEFNKKSYLLLINHFLRKEIFTYLENSEIQYICQKLKNKMLIKSANEIVYLKYLKY
jgi:hypothetical protein